MPDIFLSYSRKDIAIAGKLAGLLQATGHDVWWDQALKAGEVYDKVTEAALREARLVVVLWSKAAVVSDWVRSEATVAMQRGALLPVMIEDCQRPVMFELRQSADLIGWRGDAKDARLAALLADVARQLGAAPVSPAQTPAPTPAGPNRRLLIGGAAGLAALAAGGFGAWRFMGQTADDGTASVVVLPFANLSGDPAQAFFSDGIAEELRNALSQIRGLKVIGRVSSEAFRDSSDLAVTAAKLGVDHVLTGSVRRSPSTIRIAAQLVDGRTGVESWSASYDQPVGDALAIQSKIATNVVAALSAKLSAAAGAITVGGTSNSAAQMLLLKAFRLLSGSMTDDTQRQAQVLIDSALALDPRYADAWATKAHLISNLASVERASDAPSEAMAAIQRAVALAPRSGFVRLALARQYSDRLQMRKAHVETERGLALAPSDPRVLRDAASTLVEFDPDRSLGLQDAALALDPLNQLYRQDKCSILFFARRYREAIALLAMLDSRVNPRGISQLKALAWLALGDLARVRAEIASWQVGRPKLGITAIIEARTGNRAASDAALDQLRSYLAGPPNLWVAAVHAQRGELAPALAALEAAFRNKETVLSRIGVWDLLDPLRSEPRFKAVQDAVIPPDLFVPPKRLLTASGQPHA